MRGLILSRLTLARGITALTVLLILTLTWSLWSLAVGDLYIMVGTKERRLPIYSVKTEEKKIAISFDAAWGAEKTPIILDLLDQYDIKTTFFLVTFWVEDYPEMAKEIINRGHEIGLHSSTHPDFRSISNQQIIEELRTNHAIILETTGHTPTLFRPPYGAYDDRVLKAVEDDLGYLTIQWNVDSLDWKDVTPDFIYNRIMKLVSPGAIILFHNNAESTPKALEKLLPDLIEEGYQIVPISELLHQGEYYINHEGRQIPKPDTP